jgi:hypothetical protein
VFAEEIHYEARKGYTVVPDNSVDLHLYKMVSTPVISFGTTMPIQHEEISDTEARPLDTTIKDNPTETSAQGVESDDLFHNMIDDMVFKVWKCQRCLSLNHSTKDCINNIRCRGCFNYGHIKRNCLSAKAYLGKCWVPKKASGGELGLDTDTIIGPTEGFVGSASKAGEDALNPSAVLANDQSPPRSPPPPSSVTPSSPMANFEVDPMPWVPWGHQVIDGGPTRLPRSFYFATQDPPQQHQSDCIGIVHPPPPPNLQAFWRHQVRNFLVGPLNRNVVDYQPSLYGVGLYQFSGPTAVSALVQHGEYNINANTTVRFVPVDRALNHRAEQGFRKGWLMFVGMHPDYRNDLDIANVVSTFGKFLYWNHTDPILERVLVYAAFPSPALVPRDVVFGRFASVGGVKDSWTVPLYILTAEFAEELPANEDPMPPDGNPHPLPGNL